MPKINANPAYPVVITLSLPVSNEATSFATLIIQRGELAHMRQVAYSDEADLNAVVRDALESLAAVEANPPVIPDAPPPKPSAKPVKPVPVVPTEPTIDIPLTKGKAQVKISHLKITGGETDAAAYSQAITLVGKLIDGKLWDGQSAIRIDDVHALAKKLKHLRPRDLVLFSLTDFVQVGETATEIQPIAS